MLEDGTCPGYTLGEIRIHFVNLLAFFIIFDGKNGACIAHIIQISLSILKHSEEIKESI